MKEERKNCLLFIFSYLFPFNFFLSRKHRFKKELVPAPATFASPSISLITLHCRHQQQSRGIYLLLRATQVLQIGLLPSLSFPPFPHLCFHQLLSLAELRSPYLLFWFLVPIKPLCSIKSRCVISLLIEPSLLNTFKSKLN